MTCAPGRAVGSVTFGREEEANTGVAMLVWLLQAHRDVYQICTVLDTLVVCT